jgi:hypothetical protein
VANDYQSPRFLDSAMDKKLLDKVFELRGLQDFALTKFRIPADDVSADS